MIQSKRKISILIPLKNVGDEIRVYLQKRSRDVRVLPNHFGFWGGGVERSETAEEALLREIKKEMGINLDMETITRFNHYEFLRSIKDIFILNVAPHWEDQIVIGEGEYGKWFSTSEAMERSEIIFEDKVVINDLERFF